MPIRSCIPAAFGLISMACTTPEPVQVAFEVHLAGAPLKPCVPAGGVAVRDLRFFVHDVVLQRPDGTSQRVKLDENAWQDPRGLALLDFEDGCHNGTTPTNRVVTGTIEGSGPFEAVSFQLGVPFPLNHGDPMTARSPLTTTAMHWSWQGGYKFLRLDYQRAQPGTDAPQASRLHLGSTGCEGTLGNIAGCAHPNRPALRLPVDEQLRVVLNLDAVVLDERSDAGCMSSGEPGCAPLFAALGLQGSASAGPLFVGTP